MSDERVRLDEELYQKNEERRIPFKERVRAFLELTGMSQNELARMTIYTAATVSQVLNGKYLGDNSAVINAADSAMATEMARYENGVVAVPFVDTSISKQINYALNILSIDKRMGLIIGNTGVGKSIALKKYAKDNPSCILIEADDTYKVNTLLRNLAIKLKIGYEKVKVDILMEKIIAELADSGRMIILDEAERAHLKVLSILRRIYDMANIPVVIVGLPKLLTRIKEDVNMAQVSSRMNLIQVGKLNKIDVKNMVETVFKDASNDVLDMFFTTSKGITVYISALLRLVQRIMKKNSCDLTKDIILQAKDELIISA